ncbi:uncharacterized protein L201_006493 [Kwoniella dendrophila CBS 6074]|uniref:Alpha/beta hydrolase fold-3 domain-containing protein n=1 Tax=Kwoniella dendrophila CBS 6074 TaxID=1295534 RepID=A0AAX4K1U3_9TREE
MKKDHQKYIRFTPDPDGPNAPSPTIYRIIELLTYMIYLGISTMYIPYLVLCHLIRKSEEDFPSWTLERRITTRLNKLRVNTLYYWLPPPHEPVIWDDGLSKTIPPEIGNAYINARGKGEIELKVIKLNPVKKEYIKGIANIIEVKPVPIAGYWISPPTSAGKSNEVAQQDERVILHIHGGGYIRGHPLWTTFPMEIAKSTKLRCLSVNYRKTLSSDTAFPAPLLDVLSAYLYLIQDLKFNARDIILLGESAGGHLSLFLSQYLNDLGLDQIGYMILSSPWSNFDLSQPYRYKSYLKNSNYCQLSPLRLNRAIKSAARYYNEGFLNSNYASPCKMHINGWNHLKEHRTRVYIHYGGRELFRDECIELANGMKRDGVDVRTRIDPDGLHTSGMNGEAGKIFKKDVLQILDIT